MQIFLIFIGMTTNEYLRGIYTNITNPFNKGIFENLKEFFWKDNSKKNIDEDYLYRKDLSETQRSEMGLPKISKENTTNLN